MSSRVHCAYLTQAKNTIKLQYVLGSLAVDRGGIITRIVLVAKDKMYYQIILCAHFPFVLFKTHFHYYTQQLIHHQSHIG